MSKSEERAEALPGWEERAEATIRFPGLFFSASFGSAEDRDFTDNTDK